MKTTIKSSKNQRGRFVGLNGWFVCCVFTQVKNVIHDQVPDAIKKCQRAGIVVRMVTGDNLNTARSIAQKCGILEPNSEFLVLEGKEFNKRIRDSSGKVCKF